MKPKAARLRTVVTACASLLTLSLATAVKAQDEYGACPAPALAPVIQQAPDRSNEPLVALAESLDATNEQRALATGQVELFRADQYFSTERMAYNPASRLVELPAPFVYRDAQVQIEASQGEFTLSEDTGAFENVSFSIVGSSAHGGAEFAQMTGGQRTYLDRIWFTTCPGEDPEWRLSARELELRHDDGLAIARHARLELGVLPALYVPWMSFPIDDRRKTGFLYPSFSTANDNGVEVSIPWYWNIAPNQDATFEARYFTDRGVMMDTEYRFITRRTFGNVQAEWLPNDKNTNDSRYYGLVSTGAGLNARWNAVGEFERASDDRYFQDFGGNLVQTSRQYLRSNIELMGSGRYWIFSMLADGFQVIDESVTEEDEPYSRLPRATLLVDAPLGRSGVLAKLQSEAVYFYRDIGTTGSRLDLFPSLSWSMDPYWGFLRASAGYRFTSYFLDLDGASGDEDPDRGTPILSLDAGTYLERAMASGNTQTLEPRVFYLYVPYEDQDQLPDFDTGELTFGFAQLFHTNRFTGADRQTDANQLTLAASTRSLDATTGRENWRLSLGQIIYLESPRVTLDEDTPQDPDASPMIGEFQWHPLDRFSARLGVQWDWEEAELDVASVGFVHRSADGNRLAFEYRFRRDRVDQFDVRYYWPISETWSVVSRLMYSLEESDVLEMDAGFEYESCCWAVRAVARRYLRDRDGGYRDALYLELRLKGLGSFGRQGPSLFYDP